MTRRLISLIVLFSAWCGIASAAVYFNNSQGDNSFTNDLNWTGSIGTTGGDAVDVSGNFTYQVIPYRNHQDTWPLRNSPERDAVRKWLLQAADVRPALQTGTLVGGGAVVVAGFGR